MRAPLLAYSCEVLALMKDQGPPIRDKPALMAPIIMSALIVSGLGVFQILSGYVAGGTTGLGYAGPIVGAGAQQFGVSVIILGLLPLCPLARTWRWAAYGTVAL